MADDYVTRADEDQAEADAFAEAIAAQAGNLEDLAYSLLTRARRGDFTIPSGTDCAAFEARIKALTADIENMLDGYAPGEKRA